MENSKIILSYYSNIYSLTCYIVNIISVKVVRSYLFKCVNKQCLRKEQPIFWMKKNYERSNNLLVQAIIIYYIYFIICLRQHSLCLCSCMWS